MTTSIINKVEESGLVTLDLQQFLPQNEIVIFDLKDFLYMELILIEKDFRQALMQHDWKKYNNKYVSITCTVDAIIPMWANMLVVSYVYSNCLGVFFGNLETAQEKIVLKNINAINADDFIDKRIVVKGCGDAVFSESIYIEITKLLMPVAKSIMFGEPCSTVPIFKKKNNVSNAV